MCEIMCEINYSAAIAAPGTARSVRFQHRNHKGSALPHLHGDIAPPCPMLHRAATRAGEPLAWRAVPHLRKELSAASQIRIASLEPPHLHRDRGSLSPWMPELPLKLVSHAIRLSPHWHICIGGLDSPRRGQRSPRLESGEVA